MSSRSHALAFMPPTTMTCIVTNPANALPVRMRSVADSNYDCVFRRVFVALWAMSSDATIAVMTAFLDCIIYIVALSSNENMCWVKTKRHVAGMKSLEVTVERHSVGYAGNESMCKFLFSKVRNFWISTVGASKPNPASAFINSKRIPQSHRRNIIMGELRFPH